jgi:hypothetical protein
MLCGALAGGQHWSDMGPNSAVRQLERQLRLRLLNRILMHYDVELRPWNGDSYFLARAQGPTQLVSHLSGLWAAVEQMSGRGCDPLDPGLIAALSAEEAAPR